MIRIAIAGLLAVAVFGTPVRAEEPPPYPVFTFKRVKPPAADGNKRITVQITPEDQERAAAIPVPVPDVTPKTGMSRYGWYWDTVSPDLAAASPGRLDDVVNALTAGPDGLSVDAPRLQSMQTLADSYGIELLKATVGTNVSPALALAVIAVESGGRADAVSGAGAEGLMQLMPATADRFGVTDSLDIADNIKGGVGYLDWLMNRFDHDPVLVLAAYNAGENAVLDNQGVPDYPETRDYVPKVLAHWSVAKGLCLTPPMLLSDGCVFRRMKSVN